jgi:putative ATP-dependent endonuclease of OLD family
MIVKALDIRRFRGIADLRVIPAGHIVAMGVPRAGRSTLIEALFRVLSPDGARGTLGDDLDFHDRDRQAMPEIEVTLGDLGEGLTQLFFDQLEFWDPEENALIDELDTLDDLDGRERVVRLCYRARWLADEEQGEHWVDYPKTSDPEFDVFRRVRRADLAELPVFFGSRTQQPLALSYRGGLRELVDAGNESDFTQALTTFAEKVQNVGSELTDSAQVTEALRSVFGPVAAALGIDLARLNEAVAFVPASVALGALLRALEPTLKLDGSDVALPISRQGSTAVGVLTLAELIARGDEGGGVVAIDDFGEGVDGATACHLAASLRTCVSQAWLTTRRAEVADTFSPEQLLRLTIDPQGRRVAHSGKRPASKAERTAARHLALQLLPAAAAHAVAVLEGPHDRAGLLAVAERRLQEGYSLPAADGVVVIDAGAADSSGGATAMPRLCGAAKDLGFTVISVIDGDPGNEAVVAAAAEAADAVIRLPEGMAIEKALLDGISDSDIMAAFAQLDVSLPDDFDELEGDDFQLAASKALKSAGGLHAQFVDALPTGVVPQAARSILKAISTCVVERKSGVIQL